MAILRSSEVYADTSAHL